MIGSQLRMTAPGGAITTWTLCLLLLGSIPAASAGADGPVSMPVPVSASAPVAEGRDAASGALRARKADGVFSGTAIASDPSVARDGAHLAMSYTDLDWKTDRTVIALARSRDGGASWTPLGPSALSHVRGVVIAPRDGTWRENVEGSALVRSDDLYLLYFSGYRDEGMPQKGFPAALGLAVSQDGVTFEVRADPVISPTPGWYDNDAVYSPTVVRTGDGYFAAYAGHAYSDTRLIGRGGVFVLGASSPDGLRWEKLEAPLLDRRAGPSWMRDGAAEPALVRLGDGRWLLLFTGLRGQERVIGAALADAVEGPYEILPDPVIVPGEPGTVDDHQVLAPSALADGRDLVIWYLAVSRGGGYAIARAQARLPAERAR